MSRRIDRVNGLLRQEISSVIATELRDPRLTSMVSVTEVDTSADLRKAKVFVSVLGGPDDKAKTLKALRSAAGFVHRNMRGKLSLKSVPSLEFYIDDSIEKGAEMLEMIRRVSPGPADVPGETPADTEEEA